MFDLTYIMMMLRLYADITINEPMPFLTYQEIKKKIATDDTTMKYDITRELMLYILKISKYFDTSPKYMLNQMKYSNTNPMNIVKDYFEM